jgi:hypothetical protein
MSECYLTDEDIEMFKKHGRDLDKAKSIAKGDEVTVAQLSNGEVFLLEIEEERYNALRNVVARVGGPLVVRPAMPEDSIIDPLTHSTCRLPVKRKAKKKKPTFVYLIERGDGKIKIGRSKNPKARLDSMKTAIPEAAIIHQSRVFAKREYELHDLYKEKRFMGEWFDLDCDDVCDCVEFLIEAAEHDTH